MLMMVQRQMFHWLIGELSTIEVVGLASECISITRTISSEIRKGENIVSEAERTRPRTVALVVYWGGAALLVPWIAFLFTIQPSHVRGVHITIVRTGIAVLLIVGLVATGILIRRRAFLAAFVATATAATSFVTAWFLIVGTSHRHITFALLVSLLVLFPIVLVMAWIAKSVYRSRSTVWNVSGWSTGLCLVIIAVAVPMFVLSLHVSNDTMFFHRMRVAWTGLDIFELAGMVTTGFMIRNRSPLIALSATFTGSLLFCDAWYNVMATTGRNQNSAIAMAFVELPLAGYSIYLAIREVRSWTSSDQVGALVR